MFYLVHERLSFECGIPYVIVVHDLQHRLHPEFPEVSADGEWERREYSYRNGVRYATLLVADSESGKDDILDFYRPYGVTPDRIKILPFLPACYLSVDVAASERQRIRQCYQLPERYLFYPAQFWAHKNHARIVEAIGLLRQKHGLEVPLVLCGSYSLKIREDVFREVMSRVQQLGLVKQIVYLGYVPEGDMSGLYGGATALIMPTFFGPTNIPPLEAWAFGCPVITSDIRGIREQTGDAALLVDPRSVEAIAAGILRLWTNPRLCHELIVRGRARLAEYGPDDYRQRLRAIVDEARDRVRSHDVPRLPVPMGLSE
jgi:glycosyltransferase involved in cell wall biosynthesis